MRDVQVNFIPPQPWPLEYTPKRLKQVRAGSAVTEIVGEYDDGVVNDLSFSFGEPVSLQV